MRLDHVGQRGARRRARRRRRACRGGASTASAVEALPCGSRSMTSTRSPCWASAAAMFTAVVVLPTPPFWLATTITRVWSGRGSGAPWRPALADEQLLLHRPRHRGGLVVPDRLRASSAPCAPGARPDVARRRLGTASRWLLTPPGSLRLRLFTAVLVLVSRETGASCGKPDPSVDSYAQAATPRPVDNFRRPRPASSALNGRHLASAACLRSSVPVHDCTTVTGGLEPLARPRRRPAGRRHRGGGCSALRTSSSCSADDALHRQEQAAVRTSGSDHRASRSIGATARDVTTSNTSHPPWSSSARPRWTVTLCSPIVDTARSRNVVRRSKGSTKVTRRSGRRIASTMPGSPAPLPMSHTELPSGIRSVITAQFRRCRSQRRGTSRGPIRPRTVASPVSRSANCLGQGERDAKTPPAHWAARGVFHVKRGRPSVSRETAVGAAHAGSTTT